MGLERHLNLAYRLTFGTNSNALVADYSNDAPAIFNGDSVGVQAHVHKTASGQVNLFSDPVRVQSDFTGPVGFTIGSRNNLRGPQYFDQGLWPRQDLSLGCG